MLLGSGGSGDPYWSSVVALLHMNGSNGSTTFTDEKGHTFTRQSAATISTSQSVFGGASMTSNGTDGIESATSTDWDMGSGDWTLEFWFRGITLTGGGGGAAFLACKGNSGFYPYVVYISSGTLQLACSNNGTTYGVAFGGGSISANTWYFAAAVRSGTTFSLYLDANRLGTGTMSGALTTNSGDLAIANDGSGAATNRFNGYIDEFRLTKGVARYSGATITVPTAEFLNY